MNARALLLCCTALLHLVRCSSSPTMAGGEDFPNSTTMADAGVVVAEELEQSDQWDYFSPESLPSTAELNSVIDPALLSGKGPTGLVGGTVEAEGRLYADTGAGKIGRYIHTRYALRDIDVIDTFTYWYPDSADRDSVKGLPESLRGVMLRNRRGIRIAYHSVDSTGDGHFDYSEVTHRKDSADGETIQRVVLRAGEQRRFSILDESRIIEWSKFITEHTDTIRQLRLRDGDGDGMLLRRVGNDSAVIEARGRFARPSQRSFTMTGVWFPAQSGVSYILRYRSERRPAGRTETVSVWGGGPDSQVVYGDTAKVERTSDSLRREIRYEIVTGSGSVRDHALRAYRASRSAVSSTIIQSELRVVPSGLLRVRDTLHTGTFTLRIEAVEEGWITLEGAVAGDTITASIAQPPETAGYRVWWNRSGELLKTEQP